MDRLLISRMLWLYLIVIVISAGTFFVSAQQPGFAQEEPEKEPVTMRVVVVNPSAEKTQTVPVKIYLPEEITPKDVIKKGMLEIEYDDEKGMYYASKKDVELKPRQMQTYEVEVRDVWFIPQARLNSLKEQAALLVKQLEQTEYHEGAKKLAETIYMALDTVATTQNDETAGTKQHIGIYRNNLKIISQVKEDLERLERQLSRADVRSTPEIMQKSEEKQEPSKAIVWIVVFIMLFIGTLAGVFFFTWHIRTRSAKGPAPAAEKSASSKS